MKRAEDLLWDTITFFTKELSSNCTNKQSNNKWATERTDRLTKELTQAPTDNDKNELMINPQKIQQTSELQGDPPARQLTCQLENQPTNSPATLQPSSRQIDK
jgi:hypothetical protein